MRRVAPLAVAITLGAFSSAAQAELYYLIVGGLGGEQKYQEQFDKQIDSLAAVARKTTGDSRVTVLRGEGATREALEKSIGAIAAVRPCISVQRRSSSQLVTRGVRIFCFCRAAAGFLTASRIDRGWLGST